MGRWDIRISLDPSLTPKFPDPFDPLPVSPPGMLISPNGLPALTGRIVSDKWLRARSDTNTLPAEGMVDNPTISDSDYPLRISWNGILLDDPEQENDIVRRVRAAQEVIGMTAQNLLRRKPARSSGSRNCVITSIGLQDSSRTI